MWIRACLHYHYFFKLQQHKQRHKGKLQPASESNNNCRSVCHTGFHRKQGLEKGALMPHSCSFFTTITHPAIFFIAFSNSRRFVPKNNKIKSKNCKGKIIDFVSRQTSFNMHLVDSRLQLIHMVPEFPTNRQKILHPMLKVCRSQGSYPASRVAVKSHFLLRYAVFSQIPNHILVKSWIPGP